MKLIIASVFCSCVITCSFAKGIDSLHQNHHFHHRHHRDVVPQYRKGQHEITISGGLVSGIEILDNLGGEHSPEETSATLNYFASYKYYIFNFMAVGVTGGTQTIWLKNSPVSYTSYKEKDIYNTFALEITFAYPVLHRRNDFVNPYAIVGYGYSFLSTTYTDATFPHDDKSKIPNIQITPIGVRVGRSLAGFIEFGIGYKGLLNGGIAYDFGWKKRHINASKMSH